jgi:hypothetical protein
MARPTLEAKLAAFTQEFVAKLVDAIQNASFAEVAGLSTPRVGTPGKPPRLESSSRPSAPPPTSGTSYGNGRRANGPRLRQTAEHRAALSDRVVEALRGAPQPLGVRALSNELGVAPDLLAGPLKELRAAGRIRKLGEKRATTYST